MINLVNMENLINIPLLILKCFFIAVSIMLVIISLIRCKYKYIETRRPKIYKYFNILMIVSLMSQGFFVFIIRLNPFTVNLSIVASINYVIFLYIDSLKIKYKESKLMKNKYNDLISGMYLIWTIIYACITTFFIYK